MPCSTMPFFSRPRYSTAVEKRPVGHLPTFGFFWLPCGVPRRLLSEAYQSSSQRSIHTTVKIGSSALRKRRSVNCWTSSSDISGYHADFHKGHGTLRAWQGHGMAWQGNSMLCVNWSLVFLDMEFNGSGTVISVLNLVFIHLIGFSPQNH